MERVWWEILRRLPVRSARLLTAGSAAAQAPESVASWRRIAAPRRPVSIKLPWFYLASAPAVARWGRGAPTVSMGAITAAPVDVAHVHFCHAGFRRLGIPRQTGDVLRSANTALAGRMAVAAERACYRPTRATLLAAVSNGVAADLRTHYPDVPVRVVPNGVDRDRFRPDPGVRARLRERLQIASGRVVALFVGGEWELKGLQIAVQALARVRERCPELLLVVVGAGNRQRFQALAHSAGVADRVVFVGRQEDPSPWYQSADVFVLPSLYETFSLVAHEAAACGLPVVATPVHGIRELVGQEEAGLLVERRAESVAVALYRLTSSSELRRRLGQAARERTARYTWEQTTRAFLEVVAEARERRERRGREGRAR